MLGSAGGFGSVRGDDGNGIVVDQGLLIRRSASE